MTRINSEGHFFAFVLLRYVFALATLQKNWFMLLVVGLSFMDAQGKFGEHETNVNGASQTTL